MGVMLLRSLGIGVDDEGGGAPSETVCCVHCQALRHGRGLGAESAAAQAGEANFYFCFIWFSTFTGVSTSVRPGQLEHSPKTSVSWDESLIRPRRFRAFSA